MKLRNKKTGEIITLKDEGEIALLELVKSSLPNGLSLWEELKEPLIKDEKIRKAVRAWAEANEFASVFYEYDYSNDVARFIVGETVMIIETDEVLKYCQGYTITELCGEEEK